MTLPGIVQRCTDGMRGFDTSERVDRKDASAFFDHGYRFAVRYVRREKSHPGDLKADEAEWLLGAGLGLMIVQYVESALEWSPSAEKGAKNGSVAAEEVLKLAVPAGVTVWCDLEGVAPGTPHRMVIDYCNRWYKAVASAGYLPGLYVGWHCGLTPRELYRELRFVQYWSAYNLNADEMPAVRGVQMRQGEPTLEDVPAKVHIGFDTNVVCADKLGGLPSALMPRAA